MAVLKQKYKSLDHTLQKMKVQIIDSIEYALEVVPGNIQTPEQLFYWLKDRVKYRNDPPKTELLQTMPTMMEGAFWGTPGCGDCDCFTITTIASAISLGWPGLYICLVGREKSHPVHIYTVIYWQGKRCVLDLTNREYNHERDNYNYYQELPVRWERWTF